MFVCIDKYFYIQRYLLKDTQEIVNSDYFCEGGFHYWEIWNERRLFFPLYDLV